MSESVAEPARAVLDRFEAAIAAGDLAAMTALCTDDVVLFGTARANYGPEATHDYLRLVVEGNDAVRWSFDRWSVVHQDDEHLLVAADGQVEFDTAAESGRSPFRLTLWLVRGDEDWRIGHFHGSFPEA